VIAASTQSSVGIAIGREIATVLPVGVPPVRAGISMRGDSTGLPERSGSLAILPRLRPRTLIYVLGAATVLLASGCGSSSKRPQPAAVRPPLITILEDNGRLISDPAGTLDTLRRLGVDVAKVFVPWYTMVPASASTTPPRGFNAADPNAYPAAAWAPYDAIVRAASARGIGIDLTENAPPLWAEGRGGPPGHPQWKPSARFFGQFMHALGSRYSGRYTPPGAASPLPRVRIWSIWNEPNYGPDLAPQAIDHSQVEVSPALYRNMLDAAWSALGATGHSRDTILIGELAPRGQSGGNHPGSFDGMVPLRFLRALYCVDSSLRPLTGSAARLRDCPATARASSSFRSQHPALFEAGGFAAHPYGQGSVPPDQVTPDEPDYADLPALPKLERTLDAVQAVYGSHARLPIYSTEFGYQTNPPEQLAGAASPATAAYYENWAEYISWRDPRIRSYDQYLLADPPGANASGGFPTGLLFADGKPKATLNAFRLPLFLPVTQGTRGQQLEVWGCARPAHFTRADSASQQVEIRFRPSGATAFKTLRTVTLKDPYGYFDIRQRFDSSGTVRLRWRYPNGLPIHSRDVIISLR
jgi:hypothetical protein